MAIIGSQHTLIMNRHLENVFIKSMIIGGIMNERFLQNGVMAPSHFHKNYLQKWTEKLEKIC